MSLEVTPDILGGIVLSVRIRVPIILANFSKQLHFKKKKVKPKKSCKKSSHHSRANSQNLFFPCNFESSAWVILDKEHIFGN